MAKRTVKIKLNRKEAEMLAGILWTLRMSKNKALKKQFNVDGENKEIFEELESKVSDQVEEAFPMTPREFYEMTGGYLGDGVHVSPDGHLFSN